MALLGIAALGLVVPAAASAQCGGDTHLPPTTDLRDGPAPLAVGDSVMLGAIAPIRRAGFEVDAAGCRLWSRGLELLEERARRGSLPDLIVIALGTNWTVRNDDIGAALRVIGPERVGARAGHTPRGRGRAELGPGRDTSGRGALARPGRGDRLGGRERRQGHLGI